jgi:Holliday junction DNA helicase RuvB
MEIIKDANLQDEEVVIENNIRPSSIDEFVGQARIRENLNIFIEATKIRGKHLDHVLFYGPPGLGKTTLANIISKELGVNIRVTSGPMLMKSGDLAAILTNLGKNDILFIDEIHRLPVAVEEVLYSAMEDARLDVIIGSGPAARTIKIDLNPFTLVGATTRLGLLSNPLRDRFGIVMQLEFYRPEELQIIVQRCIQKLGGRITPKGALAIGLRARGTPRIAIRISRRIADIALFLKQDEIDENLVEQSLDRLGIDSLGLDGMDLRYVRFINENYNGGPVGIETIAAGIAENSGTLEDVVEPFLLQNGLLERTNRGRVLTRKCILHLNKS